jgi:hypothetical protein
MKEEEIEQVYETGGNINLNIVTDTIPKIGKEYIKYITVYDNIRKATNKKDLVLKINCYFWTDNKTHKEIMNQFQKDLIICSGEISNTGKANFATEWIGITKLSKFITGKLVVGCIVNTYLLQNVYKLESKNIPGLRDILETSFERRTA